VQLLEKSWAKVHGSYEATIIGLPSDALKALTGAPVEFYSHDFYTDQELWGIIKDADERRFIALASSAGEEEQDKNLKKVGLVSDHAYTILSVYEIEVKGKTLQLLKLRNPWGHQEWTGDWSD
jgi:Calpain family cysteine protease